MVALQHFKFIFGDAVGSSGLYREFKKRISGAEIVLRRVEQPVELCRIQCSRCSASDVDGVQYSPLLLHHPGALLHFLLQCRKIVPDPISVCINRKTRERAVQASRRAERNSDVEAVSLLRRESREDLSLALSNFYGKAGLFFAYAEIVAEIPDRLLRPAAFFDLPGGQLGRADSDEFTPGKLFPRDFRKGIVKQMFQCRPKIA